MKLSKKQQLELQIKLLQEQLEKELQQDSDPAKVIQQEIIDSTREWLQVNNKTTVGVTPARVAIQEHLVYCANTQVGKTDAIINTIRGLHSTLIVISCDDKYVQMQQMATRLTNAGLDHFPITQKKRIEKRLIQKKTTIVLVLNTASQVNKLAYFTTRLPEYDMGLLVINDEGDTVNKCDDVVCKIGETDGVPMVHKAWVNLLQNVAGIKRVKRLWVTATPENITSLYKLGCSQIKILPTPSNYRPITTHKKWGAKADNSFTCLQSELERVRDGGNQEVILYCVDKQNASQDRIARVIATAGNAVAIVYNGKDTRVVLPRSEYIVPGKEAISDTLDRAKSVGLPIVVVGMLLMNRGISFVSNNGTTPPVAATTMFYSGGKGTYGVSLLQKFGRITGTARPDLETRTVYCLDEDWQTYSVSLRNQQLLRDYIIQPGNGKITVHQAMQSIEQIEKLGRDIEKLALKSVNREYAQVYKSRHRNVIPEAECKLKRVRLITRWTNPDNDDSIAQLFRAFKQATNHEMTKQAVRVLLPRFGATEKTYIYDLTNKNHSTQWHLVFEETLDKTGIRLSEEAIALLD